MIALTRKELNKLEIKEIPISFIQSSIHLQSMAMTAIDLLFNQFN